MPWKASCHGEHRDGNMDAYSLRAQFMKAAQATVSACRTRASEKPALWKAPSLSTPVYCLRALPAETLSDGSHRRPSAALHGGRKVRLPGPRVRYGCHPLAFRTPQGISAPLQPAMVPVPAWTWVLEFGNTRACTDKAREGELCDKNDPDRLWQGDPVLSDGQTAQSVVLWGFTAPRPLWKDSTVALCCARTDP